MLKMTLTNLKQTQTTTDTLEPNSFTNIEELAEPKILQDRIKRWGLNEERKITHDPQTSMWQR